MISLEKILDLKNEDLESIITEEEFERMQNLGMYTWELLDALKEGARLSVQDEEEYITISSYLDYLEDMKNQ